MWKGFTAHVHIIIWLFSLSLLIKWMIVMDLLILNHSFFHEINPTQLWFIYIYIFKWTVGFHLPIFYQISLHQNSGIILVYDFHLWYNHFQVWGSVLYSVKLIWQFSLFLCSELFNLHWNKHILKFTRILRIPPVIHMGYFVFCCFQRVFSSYFFYSSLDFLHYGQFW